MKSPYVQTLADVATTLTTKNRNGIVLLANTGIVTHTLPPAADMVGYPITFKKTTAAAFAVTLDGNGAETIDGAATDADIDAQYDTKTIVSDGSNWHIVESIIA